jgi:hypothetical protein
LIWNFSITRRMPPVFVVSALRTTAVPISLGVTVARGGRLAQQRERLPGGRGSGDRRARFATASAWE